MPKAFSEEEKQIIRDRLLEVGNQRFAAVGLQKTNVEELAKAAGISKGAFYGFFESKEALFMAVMEVAEEHFRQELFAKLAEPGPTPRARLVALLSHAFKLWKEIPPLRFVAMGEYDQLMRRVPPGVFAEHVQADDEFIAELIRRCRADGIPIVITASEMRALAYALVLTSLHEGDALPLMEAGTLDLMIELFAAYCLGEVELHSQSTSERL